MKYMHGKLNWEPRPKCAHDTCIKSATNVYYKRELPRTWTQNVPTAQKMHVFVLWQLLRDETNFCWERCPCRTAPGQNDFKPQIPELPAHHHHQHHHHTTIITSMLCTNALIDRHSMAPTSVIDDACVTSVTMDKV